MRKYCLALVSLLILVANSYAEGNHWVKLVQQGYKSFVAVHVTTFKEVNEPGKPPAIELSGGLGSGVFVDKEGLILTAGHMVTLDKGEHIMQLQVLVDDGQTLEAELIKVSTLCDLALIKVKGYKSVPVKLAKSATTGQDVMLIGNPMGLMRTVTTGIISSATRLLGEHLYYTQFDAGSYGGSSGGPLVDWNGNLVGIMSRMRTNELGFPIVGFSFAVPLEEIKAFLKTYRRRLTLGDLK